MNNTEDPKIKATTTRVVGISVLRKLRKLVDEENSNDQLKTIWAKRVATIA